MRGRDLVIRRNTLPEPARPVLVCWTSGPFGGRAFRMMVEAGLSIDAIARRAHGLPADFFDEGTACVNGRAVPAEWWGRTRVRPRRGCRCVVTLHPRPGRGVNIGQLLAAIALLIITAGTISFLTPLIGGFWATVAGGMVGIGGALAISALAAQPGIPALPGVNQSPSFQLGAASISGNPLAPDARLPYVAGTQRLALPFGTEPYLEISGEEMWGEVLLVCRGPARFVNTRAGDTPIEDLGDAVQIEIGDGLPGSPPLTLINRIGKQTQPQIEGSRHQVTAASGQVLEDQARPERSLPIWHPLASKRDPDEIVATLVWPESLIDFNNPTLALVMPVRTRIRARGSAGWINLPELHFAFSNQRPSHRYLKFKFEVPDLTVPKAPTADGPVRAYKTVPAQTISPPRSGWQADDYFSAGSGGDLYQESTFDTHLVRGVSLNRDGAEVHLDPALFPRAAYDIQMMFGAVYYEVHFTAATYAFSGVVYDLFGYWQDGALLKAPRSRTNIRDSVTIAAIASVRHQSPIGDYEGLAWMALRWRSRRLEEISTEVSMLVPDWNGSEWTGRVATPNPAPHVRYLLSQHKPRELIGDAVLLDWRQHCINNGYEVSAVLQDETVLEGLGRVTAAGYARPRQSERFDVIIDRDRAREGPVQVFSQRNSNNYRFEKVWLQPSGGAMVRFKNRALDWAEDTVTVPDPELRRRGLAFEQSTNGSQDAEAAVIANALFAMRQARRRLTFRSFDTAANAIQVTRGDLIGFSHDTLSHMAGSAFVRDVLSSGGLVTGLVLDGSIPLSSEAAWSNTAAAWSSYGNAWAAPRYAMAIRLKGGVTIVKEIVAAEAGDNVRVIAFVTPFADPGTLSVYGQPVGRLGRGVHVVAGPLTDVYRRLIVWAMKPKDGTGAEEWSFTCVDEAADLWPQGGTVVA